MSDQGTSNPEIFSSTGDPGTRPRPDERLYHNATAFYDNAPDVAATFFEVIEDAETINAHMLDHEDEHEPISRVVFRGIVSDQAVQDIAGSELAVHLEVAMPVNEHRTGAGWLIYLAQNQPHRQPLHDIDTMVTATSTYPPAPKRRKTDHPLGDACLPEWSLHTTIKEGYEDQLVGLWKSTFGGWDDDKIAHLAQRVADEKAKNGPQRSLWFSALAAGDLLMSAAMAERLTLPGQDGPVELVESTEWRTRNGFSNHGLMTRTLRALNAQIFHSLGDNKSGPPLVYAECSFSTRADRAGHGAGFYIPERRHAPQIARQNVKVDDGVHPPGLRDFIVMRASTPPAYASERL